MSAYADTAGHPFEQGYNGPRAVFPAFRHATGPDSGIALRPSSPFGGMRRLGEVCGAVTGMCMPRASHSGMPISRIRRQSGAAPAHPVACVWGCAEERAPYARETAGHGQTCGRPFPKGRDGRIGSRPAMCRSGCICSRYAGQPIETKGG